ncbi:TetR/AcrR family transcriptional regulator [Spirillospora sp. NPDC050679]
MVRPRTTTDEALLAATARAIGLHGLNGLTLAAVAGEAGVSPATLVQRFGSKRGLLLALAQRSEAGTKELFRRAREEHTSALAALHGVLVEMAADVRSPQELANHLGFLQLDLADEEFRRHAATQARVLHEGFTELIEEAVEAGELVSGVDPARLARSVQIAYNGSLIVWALTSNSPLADELRADVDQLLQAYLP